MRAAKIDHMLGTPDGVGGPMTKEMVPCGSMVSVPVASALAGTPSGVDDFANVTAPALAADHTQFFSTGAMGARGVFKQRTRTAWGHTAHWGPEGCTPPSLSPYLQHRLPQCPAVAIFYRLGDL